LRSDDRISDGGHANPMRWEMDNVD